MENIFKECEKTYCQNCGQPKFCEIEGHRFPVKCLCEQQEIERIRRQEMAQAAIQQFNSKQGLSMMGEKYKKVRFNNSKITKNNQANYIKLQNYLLHSKEMIENNIGLYVYGDNSTGKTHATAALCNELLQKGYTCIFTNLATIKNQTFDKNSQLTQEMIIYRIQKADFVFIDDIGKEFIGRENDIRSKKWLEDLFFEIINSRYNENKPTIFSSNYSIQELIDLLHIDKAIVERINEMSSDVILFNGDDFRGINIDSKAELLKKYGV